MKSYSLVSLRVVTSGFEIKTFGFPPNFASLASISPKALETLILLKNELKAYRELPRSNSVRNRKIENIERWI